MMIVDLSFRPFSVTSAKLDIVPFWWCIDSAHNRGGTINVDYFQTSQQT